MSLTMKMTFLELHYLFTNEALCECVALLILEKGQEESAGVCAHVNQWQVAVTTLVRQSEMLDVQ